MTRPFLSVIIPAWNEARRLPLTLIDIDRYLSAQDFTSEIIVVLSPSSDNTAEILKRFQSIIKHLKVVTLIENQGKGFALHEGMKIALGMYRLTMDADNSTAIIEFSKMLPYLTDKKGATYDLIIGSRWLPGSQMDPLMPPIKRFFTKLSSTIIRNILLPGIRDPRCGFKCFSATAADKIFPLCQTKTRVIEIEITTIAKKLGFAIKEVSVFWSYDSDHRPQSKISALREYFIVWKNTLKKRYSPK